MPVVAWDVSLCFFNPLHKSESHRKPLSHGTWTFKIEAVKQQCFCACRILAFWTLRISYWHFSLRFWHPKIGIMVWNRNFHTFCHDFGVAPAATWSTPDPSCPGRSTVAPAFTKISTASKKPPGGDGGLKSENYGGINVEKGFFCHCCVLTRHFFQGSTCSHRCSQGSPTVSVRRIWIGGSGGKRLNLVEDPHGSSSHQWVSILSHDLVRLGWCGGPQV
jgi:hypothetical protein